jgi:hypothetical protein
MMSVLFISTLLFFLCACVCQCVCHSISSSLPSFFTISPHTSVCTSAVQVFDSLMVRHWDTWDCYDKRNHVFVAPLTVSPSGSLEASTLTLSDLMGGLATDCPPKPFGGAEEYETSPEGDVMVLTCRRVTDEKRQPRDMAWSSEGE